jgi:hypothetical protein
MLIASYVRKKSLAKVKSCQLRIDSYSAEKGYVLSQRFQDCGEKDYKNRKGLNSLLNSVREGSVHCLVLEDLDSLIGPNHIEGTEFCSDLYYRQTLLQFSDGVFTTLDSGSLMRLRLLRAAVSSGCNLHAVKTFATNKDLDRLKDLHRRLDKACSYSTDAEVLNYYQLIKELEDELC